MQGHLRVLGSIRAVTAAGEDVHLGGMRPRTVLAVLAADPGQVIRTETLIDAVWADGPPATARSALQVHVAALRKALDGRVDAHIVTVAGGYRLDVGPLGLDARAFEADCSAGREAMRSGRYQRASRAFDAGLARWHGPAFDGLDDVAPVQAEIARLHGVRQDATERRRALEIAQGNFGDAVMALESQVQAHPYWERTASLLALALAGSGRQADALDRLRSLRSRMIEDLGVEPAEPVAHLEHLLLTQDPVLHEPWRLPGLQELFDGEPSMDQPKRTGTADRALPRTELIGRQGLVDRLVEAVSDHRLVTVAGPAGVGKTRLAAEVVALTDEDREALWVELRGLDSSRAVVAAVLSAMGERVAPGQSAGRRVADLLAQRPWLLVLDEGEALAEPLTDLLDRWLTHCPGLHLLVTSRRRLGINGEQVVRVPPLEPDGALALLVGRARNAGVPEAALHEEQALSALCDHLDGLPLAIELAAPHLGTFSPPELVGRLDRFVDGADTREHQRGLMATVRSTVDWVSPEAVRVLEVASAFEGPFTLGDLAAVANDDALAATLTGVDGDPGRALSELVDASLIEVVDPGEPRRFRLLAAIRRYAARRVRARGGEPELLAAHARWLTALVERAARAGAGAKLLDRIWPDLVAAARALGEWPAGSEAQLRLVDAVWFDCFASGRATEARVLLGEAVARPEGDGRSRSRVLAALGFLAWWQGDYRAARSHLVEAASVNGDRHSTAFLGVVEGSLAWMAGDLEASDRHLGDAVGSLEARGGWPAVFALSMAGSVSWFLGHLEKGLDRYRRAGRLAAGVPGSPFATALVVRHEAMLLSAAGEHAAAVQRAHDGMALARRLGDPFTLGQAAGFTGICIARSGDVVEALSWLDEGFEHLAAATDLLGLTIVVAGTSGVATELDHLQVAARLCGWVDRSRDGGIPLPADLAAAHRATKAALGGALGERFEAELLDGWTLEVAELIDLCRTLTRSGRPPQHE